MTTDTQISQSIIKDMGFIESMCFSGIFILLSILIFYLIISESSFAEDSAALRIITY